MTEIFCLLRPEVIDIESFDSQSDIQMVVAIIRNAANAIFYIWKTFVADG